jgi:hypothetical protein
MVANMEQNTDAVPIASGANNRARMGVRRIAATWANVAPETSLTTSIARAGCGFGDCSIGIVSILVFLSADHGYC